MGTSRDLTWLFKAQILRAAKNPSLEDLCEIVPEGRVSMADLGRILGKSYPTTIRLTRVHQVKMYRAEGNKGAWQIPVEEVHRLLTLGAGVIRK